jgi:hypothetical protein
MKFSKKHNQHVLRTLHEKGIEMTPGELDLRRKDIFAALRAKVAVEHPWLADASDYEMLVLCREALKVDEEERDAL